MKKTPHLDQDDEQHQDSIYLEKKVSSEKYEA